MCASERCPAAAAWLRTLQLALGLLGVMACAGSPGPESRPAEARAPAAREDASSRFLPEAEVDVAARPRTPIRPRYPQGLRALGVEGEVRVRVAVRADGSVAGARILASDHPDFSEAVREALRKARFVPGRRGGEPAASWVPVRLRFRLEE